MAGVGSCLDTAAARPDTAGVDAGIVQLGVGAIDASVNADVAGRPNAHRGTAADLTPAPATTKGVRNIIGGLEGATWRSLLASVQPGAPTLAGGPSRQEACPEKYIKLRIAQAPLAVRSPMPRQDHRRAPFQKKMKSDFQCGAARTHRTAPTAIPPTTQARMSGPNAHIIPLPSHIPGCSHTRARDSHFWRSWEPQPPTIHP